MNIPALCFTLALLLSSMTVLADANFYEAKALAEKGDLKSQLSVAISYINGDGIPQDYDQGIKWITLAAERGYVPAQANLGAFYEVGCGVPKDYVLSYVWRNLSASKGDKNSKEAIGDLEKKMTREQIAEAQKLSRVYSERIEAAKAKK